MTREALVAYSVGLLGINPGKSARTGILCAPEHQNTGQNRDRHLDRHATDELRFSSRRCSTPGWRWRSDSGACLNAGLLFYQLRKQRNLSAATGLAHFLCENTVKRP
jgi:hypothetical protein